MLAFLVGVAPNLPGFINSVNPKVDPGVGSRPYTFAWYLGFAITSLIYVLLSTIFKPTESIIPRAIKPDEVYESGYAGQLVEGKVIGVDSDLEKNARVIESSEKGDEDELKVI